MKDTLRPSYKQTEVGVIPEDWDVKPLADVFTLKHGFAFSSAYFSKSGPIVLTPGNFRLEGGLYFEERNIKRYSGSYSPAMTFRKGDLLIVMTDLTPDCNLLGKPAFVETDEVVLHNQRIGRVQLKDRSVDLQFMFYLLLSRPYLGWLKEQATGSTVRHTSNKSIYSVQLAWPPPPEQRAIAAALSDVDALLAKLDQFTAKKRDLKQAAMQQLLTGQTRLPGFSGAWEVKGLGDVCRITTGKKDVNEGNPAGQYPFFTCARAHTFSDSFSFDGEAILIAGNGEVGNLNYFNGKFEAYQRTYVLQGFTTNVSYLWHQLSAHLAKSLGIGTIGSSIPYIKMENLVGFEFRSPLDQSEQTAIATILSDMDAEIAALEARRDKTRALKQGMMQALLTGRIRLVDPVPSSTPGSPPC